MELLVKRSYKGENYTIGHLYVNGQFFCDTIEDVDRKLTSDMDIEQITQIKVYGETAIPTGTYNVIINQSAVFKKELPLLENVKGFSGIRIHTGNTQKDSLGCIIVGQNKVKGQVINSKITFSKLMPILKNAFDSGEKISITII